MIQEALLQVCVSYFVALSLLAMLWMVIRQFVDCIVLAIERWPELEKEYEEFEEEFNKRFPDL